MNWRNELGLFKGVSYYLQTDLYVRNKIFKILAMFFYFWSHENVHKQLPLCNSKENWDTGKFISCLTFKLWILGVDIQAKIKVPVGTLVSRCITPTLGSRCQLLADSDFERQQWQLKLWYLSHPWDARVEFLAPSWDPRSGFTAGIWGISQRMGALSLFVSQKTTNKQKSHPMCPSVRS